MGVWLGCSRDACYLSSKNLSDPHWSESMGRFPKLTIFDFLANSDSYIANQSSILLCTNSVPNWSCGVIAHQLKIKYVRLIILRRDHIASSCSIVCQKWHSSATCAVPNCWVKKFMVLLVLNHKTCSQALSRLVSLLIRLSSNVVSIMKCQRYIQRTVCVIKIS